MNNIQFINLTSHPYNIVDNTNNIIKIVNQAPMIDDSLYLLPPFCLRNYNTANINDKHQNDLLNESLNRLSQELNKYVLISYPTKIKDCLLDVYYYILGNGSKKFIGNLNFELNHYQKQPLQKLNFIYNNKSYTILPYLDEIHELCDENIILQDIKPFSYQHYLNVLDDFEKINFPINIIYQSINSFQSGNLYPGLVAVRSNNENYYSELYPAEGVLDIDKFSKFKDTDKNFDSIIYKSLIVGLNRFMKINKFNDVVIGISGGIDSAVVATLATEALGADHVIGLIMPSMFTTSLSITDAEQLSNNLKIDYYILPITSIYNTTLDVLKPAFKKTKFSTAEENLQARIRMLLLMAYSNKFGHIVLNCSNKSELSVGYGTLYGDLAGSISVIGDLYKTQVYQIANYINEINTKEIIPKSIITKAPSAELHADQKDEDTLPPYDLLDLILYNWIEENRWSESTEKLMHKLDLDISNIEIKKWENLKKIISANEFKRNQLAPIIRLSHKPLNEVSFSFI